MPQPFRFSVVARALPFAVFIAFLALRGHLGDRADLPFDARWVYAAGVLVTGALLIAWRREYGELSSQLAPNSREWALAIAAGFGVFLAWISLDAAWMTLGQPTASFVPLNASGDLDLPLLAARFIGAALLVPVMEELFWRSFLMRWIESPVFTGVAPRQVGLKAIVLSTFVFMLAHTQWLAAVVAGLAYAVLYVRTGKLWVAVIAHAVTNAALGVWVVATGQWRFW
jgi:uncharacterized protein